MLQYIHGSEDSTDIDIICVFDKIPDKIEAQKFCADLSEVNKNIIVVENGVVTWVYKGTIDEVNNALYYTIPLHENPESIIEKLVERDILTKTIRVMRGTLTQCSRTQHRKLIKKATRGFSWKERVQTLKDIKINEIEHFGKKNKVELYKFFAFQWGQLIGLTEGIELYTKSNVADQYPELRPYLYREEKPFDQGLHIYYQKVTDYMDSLEVDEESKKEQHIIYFQDFHKWYDVKNEIKYTG